MIVTEDRESGIRGILGTQAHMIPMHISIDGPEGSRKVNVEVLDLPSLTSQAVLVVLYDSLLQSNESTAETSYHITGSIYLANYPRTPLDEWASPGGMMPEGSRAPRSSTAAWSTAALVSWASCRWSLAACSRDICTTTRSR